MSSQQCSCSCRLQTQSLCRMAREVEICVWSSVSQGTWNLWLCLPATCCLCVSTGEYNMLIVLTLKSQEYGNAYVTGLVPCTILNVLACCYQLGKWCSMLKYVEMRCSVLSKIMLCRSSVGKTCWIIKLLHKSTRVDLSSPDWVEALWLFCNSRNEKTLLLKL